MPLGDGSRDGARDGARDGSRDSGLVFRVLLCERGRMLFVLLRKCGLKLRLATHDALKVGE